MQTRSLPFTSTSFTPAALLYTPQATPSSYIHSYLQLSVSALTLYAGTLCPFPSPTHPPAHTLSHVSNPSLAHWPDMRQYMSWQVQSQMHNKPPGSQIHFRPALPGWQGSPSRSKGWASLRPTQLGTTGSLPAAESCRAFRKILLPNCLNVETLTLKAFFP